MLRLQFCLLLFFFPFIICAQQQNYVFQHLTAKDGLASDKVLSVFQDSKGFYWVETSNGLQKFDGKNFINMPLQNEYRITNILDWPHINSVEDKEGNVWVYNQGSVYVYHLTGNVDTVQINDDTTTNTKISDIISFCKDEWGNMWIATWTHIYKYDSNNNKCILWLSSNQVTNSAISCILYDSAKKSIWFAGGKEIFLVDIQTKKITRPFFSYHPDKNDAPGNFPIITCWLDSKQNLWFNRWDGLLYKYNTVTYKKEVYDVFNKGKSKDQPDKTIAFCFVEDTNGTIWIGCYNGGLYYYNEKSTMQPVAANNNVPYALHYDYYIAALCKDKEGNILVGSDKGLNVFNPSFQKFTTVDENNLLNPFPKTEVNKVFETSSGNILVGTWGKGWFLYDKKFNLKKQFYTNTKASANSGGYRKNLVWSFAEDNTGKIWIGYQHGLIGIFDTTNQQVQYIEVSEFDKKTIMALRCDAKGNMWFGLYSGFLGKWDVIQRRFFVYKDSLPFPNKGPVTINDILINKHGEVWVATAGNGFYRFDPLLEKVTEWYVPDKKNSTLDYTVRSLTEINDSVIGVTTFYKGFLLFNQLQKTFTSFTVQNGLPVNETWGLAQDKQNNLWIAASNALLRMNTTDHKLVSFDEDDGLLNKQFLSNIVLLHDGRMAIPASSGFVYFSPGNIKMLPPSDVQITGFKLFDKSLLIDSILFYDANKVDLNHTQNFITVEYACLSFSGRNTTQYFYQLDGVDKDWVKAGTKRFAGYTNLSPGHYNFQVKCENRYGISSKITRLSIYIRPPWWFTWWAYCLYTLLAASILYTLYQNNINQLKNKQSAQIKAMVATQEQERKRISRDLHDDVGTKLSALKLFLSSLREKASGTNNEEIISLAESSEQFIKEAIQDVRGLLLNLSPSILEEFGYTTAVEGLVNKINETKQIHFSLIIFGMSQRLQKEYELALYRITQELINNVLKHAEAKNVALQIGERDEKIILMIEDDGKGFDVNAHKDGYGLNNLEARTKLMQGTMTIDSHAGKGTSVLIEIPYNFS